MCSTFKFKNCVGRNFDYDISYKEQIIQIPKYQYYNINEQLKTKIKRLQDIAKRTEAEKEEYADLYCKCENELIKNRRRCDGV